MVNLHEFTYPSSDGVHQIHAVEWQPEGSPRAVLQFVHGIAEHIGRYDAAARFFAERGFLVCGEDHLGHGKTVTDGKYGFFAKHDGWTLVTADVRRLRQLTGEKYPNIPYFILGHSMGSFLLRTYLCRCPGELDGAIISGTGQESAATVSAGKALAELLCGVRGPEHISDLLNQMAMGSYNKAFAPSRTSCDWLTRDEAIVDDYVADPLCGFTPTVSLFRDMMGGLQYIAQPRHLAQMDVSTPVYFLSGDHDPVGGMGKGVEKVVGMFRDTGCGDVTVKLYPDGRHEMLNELNRQQVMEELLGWIEGKR